MVFHKALRMKGFDYQGSYLYFITICTHDRTHIIKGPLKDSVAERLREMEVRFSIKIDTSIVMENHIHMIVWIPHTETSLPKILQAYKSITTRGFWQLGGKGRLWQKGYWEHVIRNERALGKIRSYIMNNPEQERYDFESLYRESVDRSQTSCDATSG